MATTVRVRGGKTLRGDGPFTQTNEFIARIDVVSCADRQQAIQLAAAHPIEGETAGRRGTLRKLRAERGRPFFRRARPYRQPCRAACPPGCDRSMTTQQLTSPKLEVTGLRKS
jgi:hypothetical protein